MEYTYFSSLKLLSTLNVDLNYYNKETYLCKSLHYLLEHYDKTNIDLTNHQSPGNLNKHHSYPDSNNNTGKKKANM